MKTKLGVILMAAVLAVGMLATVSADEPVAGWNLARWGMSATEIQTVYQNTKTVKAGTWAFDGHKYHGDVTLAESMRLGGYDFEVRFLMDDSERLAAVQLRNFGRGDFPFDTVKELLVQKYGKPTIETAKSPIPHLTKQQMEELLDKDSKVAIRDPLRRWPDDVFRKSTWLSAKAQVTLGSSSLPRSRQSGVILTYAMPDDTDKL